MEIIEYQDKYQEDFKDLLVELQVHIANLDQEGYNIVKEEFRESYFLKTIKEVEEKEGKIFLAIQEKKVVGVIVGIMNNNPESSYDFRAPKRGRVTELIIHKDVRGEGIGKSLLHTMEKYFKDIDCEDVILGVFGYNDQAKKFYYQQGYHDRYIEVSKKIS